MLFLLFQMQGVGAKGWKSVSSLFNKDDEHQLLEAETDTQPVADQWVTSMTSAIISSD